MGIFKEARSAYKEKKESLRQERFGNVRRAHTFDVPRGSAYHGPFVEECDDPRDLGGSDDYHRHHRSLRAGAVPLFLEGARRLSLDDGDGHYRQLRRSATSGDAVAPARRSSNQPSRPPLTVNNLRTHSEYSASCSSAAPRSYRNDRGLGAESSPPRGTSPSMPLPAEPSARYAQAPRPSMLAHRPRSDPALGLRANASKTPSSSKTVDMNLAYGSIPPDLESRVDLDLMNSAFKGASDQPGHSEEKAKTLVGRIEALLTEAQCLHHTAASIIRHLQDNPEAAAAVALTLAELSALLAKLSPSFLGVVQGGSPAVFALLASPQFLIGTGIAVGVTVVMFGGWKIIKRMKEVHAAREEEKQTFGMGGLAHLPQHLSSASPDTALPAAAAAPTMVSAGFDEALVLGEELSTIETWRRGIVPPLDGAVGLEPWEGSAADVELISPEAMRSRTALDDERTPKSVWTRTSKSHGDISLRRSGSRQPLKNNQDNSRKGKKSKGPGSSLEVPERDSSRDFQGTGMRINRHHHHRCRRCHADGTESEAGTDSTSRSHTYSSRASVSKGQSAPPNAATRSTSSPLLPDRESTPDKDKKTNGKGNMLRQLFKKKKDRDDKEWDDAAASGST